MLNDEDTIESKLTIDGGKSHAEAMFDEEDEEKAGDVEGASEFGTSRYTGDMPTEVAADENPRLSLAQLTQLPLPEVKNPPGPAVELPKYLVRCEALVKEGQISTRIEYVIATSNPERDVVQVNSRALETRLLEAIPIEGDVGVLATYVKALSQRRVIE